MTASWLSGGRVRGRLAGLHAGLHTRIPLAHVPEIQYGYDAAARVAFASAVDDGALAAAQRYTSPLSPGRL